MATIELVQTAADWKDNSTGTPLPAGKWSVSGTDLVLTDSVLATTDFDYGPDRLAVDSSTPTSVFYPGSEFMVKDYGDLVLEITPTSCSADLTNCGVFVLVEYSGFSGSYSPEIAPFVDGVATKTVACFRNVIEGMFPVYEGFPTNDNFQQFLGLGFIPHHIVSDTRLATFLGVPVTWSLDVKAYWSDGVTTIPLFWTNLSGQIEV